MTTAIYLGVVVLPLVLLLGNLFRQGEAHAGSRLLAMPRALVSGVRAALPARKGPAPPIPVATLVPAAAFFVPAEPVAAASRPSLRTPSSPDWVPAPGYAAFPSSEPDAAVMLTAASPEPDFPVAQRLEDKTCPDCAETVAHTESVCPHCGFGVLTVQRTRVSATW